jgi:hypothetical protein
MARLGRFACRERSMPEGKEKTLRRFRLSTDGLRAGQPKTRVFQPFFVGERTGEGIACKYKLV